MWELVWSENTDLNKENRRSYFNALAIVKNHPAKHLLVIGIMKELQTYHNRIVSDVDGQSEKRKASKMIISSFYRVIEKYKKKHGSERKYWIWTTKAPK